MSTKVDRIYVTDDTESINENLESMGLDADAIISILHEPPGRAFATGETRGRYEVFYRLPE